MTSCTERLVTPVDHLVPQCIETSSSSIIVAQALSGLSNYGLDNSRLLDTRIVALCAQIGLVTYSYPDFLPSLRAQLDSEMVRLIKQKDKNLCKPLSEFTDILIRQMTQQCLPLLFHSRGK